MEKRLSLSGCARRLRRIVAVAGAVRFGLAAVAAAMLVTASAASAATQPPPFLKTWGTQGDGPGQFYGPTFAATGPSGDVYVSDSYNSRIEKFDANGNFLTAWGSRGSAPGQFSSPSGVAVDTAGNVYVADTENSRIEKFNANGTFLKAWASPIPLGLAVDSAGNVYVADVANLRIDKYDANGNLLANWSLQGNTPHDVAVDSAGDVYVSIRFNGIEKFDANGNLLTSWKLHGSADGQYTDPAGISVGPLGNVYVADFGQNRIEEYDANGAYLTSWGGAAGSGDDQFQYVYDVAVDQDGVYVVDWGNNRIVEFGAAPNTTPPTLLTSWGVSQAPASLVVGPAGDVYVVENYWNQYYGLVGQVQKFDASGKLLATFGGGQNDQFGGLAVDSTGNVYVADYSRATIDKFDSNGNLLTTIGSHGSSPGQLTTCAAVAVDAAGDVYALDPGGYGGGSTMQPARIDKFDSNGNFLTAWGSTGTGNGQFENPEGIAVDPAGNVYVADTFNYRIQKFDANGNFLTAWGSHGTGNNQFEFPTGVAVDAAGNVYVADPFNYRVDRFDPYGGFLTSWHAGYFPWNVSIDSSGDMYVADPGTYKIFKFGSAPADTTPPVTTDNAPSGWSNTTVTITLSATDNLSGVAATYYSVDGGSYVTGTSITIPAPADHSNDGTHTISYYSVDNAGNKETPHTATVSIDTTPPTLAPTVSPNPAALDASATATAGAADALSGLAYSSCDIPDTSAYGTFTVSCTATDNAGNRATATASYQVTVQATTAAVISNITTTAATGSANQQSALRIATTAMQSALTTGLWSDGNNSASQTVFNDLKRAADALNALLQQPSTISTTTVQSWIQSVIGGARELAANAIAHATAAGGNAKQIALANKELNAGDTAANQGHTADAIADYENAWRQVAAK